MDKNEKIINNIKATMGMEGMFLEENDIEIINGYLNKEITEAQGIELIKNEFKDM